MSFHQLYYTNCEHGLSGYAGYQFNAVTDGTSGETLRAVESLTAYEPPRSCAYPSTAEELELCPVNLCFAPGQTTILASVSYVGRDSSQRFGNYFAHALATADLDADDADLLPIELWRAAWWNRRPVPDTSLPALDGPLHAGPLSRERVAGFLADHPHRGRLAALLSAAGLAQSRADRSVLVVAESADDVASWCAAVSYLLPPRWVRRLSFSTYLNRPSRSRLHLLGTLPETKLDLGPDAEEKFYLFDFPGERFPTLAVHPLASLCVSIGLLELPALWGWVDKLARGDEATLDDWYPAVAAAAALGRVSVTQADLDAVIGWLHDGVGLPEATQNAIARAVHGHPDVTMGHRRTLLAVSARTGDTGLWEQVYYELLEPLLLLRTDGPTVARELLPSATAAEFTAALARVRDQLTAKAEEQLRLAEDQADTLGLLDWSGLAALPIGPDVLAECGRTTVAPLLADGLTEAQRDQAIRVAEGWPTVREGIVHYLTALADREPATVSALLAGITGELLADQDIPADSPLRVPYLAHRALRRRERPVTILANLARHGTISEADDLLLSVLWPTRSWSLADAAEVLAAVDGRVLAGTVSWFEATLARRPAEPASRVAYARLCDDLMVSPLAALLAGRERPALDEIAELYRARAGARRLRDLLPIIGALRDRDSAPALVLSWAWLAPEVARLPADTPAELVTALARMNGPGVGRYLELIRRRFSAPDASIPVHAAALWLLAGTEWVEPYNQQVTELLLGYAIRSWRSEPLAEAVSLVESVEPASAREFRGLIGQAKPERQARTATVLRGVGRRVSGAGRRLGRVVAGPAPKAADSGTTPPER